MLPTLNLLVRLIHQSALAAALGHLGSLNTDTDTMSQTFRTGIAPEAGVMLHYPLTGYPLLIQLALN